MGIRSSAQQEVLGSGESAQDLCRKFSVLLPESVAVWLSGNVPEEVNEGPDDTPRKSSVQGPWRGGGCIPSSCGTLSMIKFRSKRPSHFHSTLSFPVK